MNCINLIAIKNPFNNNNLNCFLIINSLFILINSTNDGGAIGINNIFSNLTLKYSSFFKCMTTQNGGAIFSNCSNIIVSKCCLNNCFAPLFAGGYLISFNGSNNINYLALENINGRRTFICFHGDYYELKNINSSNHYHENGYGLGFYFNRMNNFSSKYFTISKIEGFNIFESYYSLNGYSEYININNCTGYYDILRSTTKWNISNSIFINNKILTFYIRSYNVITTFIYCYFENIPNFDGKSPSFESCFYTSTSTQIIIQFKTYLCGSLEITFSQKNSLKFFNIFVLFILNNY